MQNKLKKRLVKRIRKVMILNSSRTGYMFKKRMLPEHCPTISFNRVDYLYA